MGCFDQHLWEFTIAKQSYGARRDAAKARLYDVLKPRKTTIDYLYDFWRLLGTPAHCLRPSAGRPRYRISALYRWRMERATEGCGGIPGFYATLDAIADPANPDPADAIEWFEDYNPKAIDELGLKYALSRIAKRRNAAAARLVKKKSTPDS